MAPQEQLDQQDHQQEPYCTFNNQPFPTRWTKQKINVGIFGGPPVDACWTTNPCMVMYIYNDQTCPTCWTLVNINAAVINGFTTLVDAYIKCN
jgi:hypothetical protein